MQDLISDPSVALRTLQMRWTKLQGAISYQADWRRHDGDAGWVTLKATKPEALLQRLDADTVYDVRIWPNGANGLGKPAYATVGTAGPSVPLWSDLVVDSARDNELDVTRVQMLFFSVVVALFVLLRVVASSMIPEIPAGFLVLMVISNSVYLGAKFISS